MSRPTFDVWKTPGIIERLTELWAHHRLSGSKISEALKSEFGIQISRQAVLRRIDKIGLTGKGGSQPATKLYWRDEPPPITLPSVGGTYYYKSGRLVRDGVPIANRQEAA